MDIRQIIDLVEDKVAPEEKALKAQLRTLQSEIGFRIKASCDIVRDAAEALAEDKQEEYKQHMDKVERTVAGIARRRKEALEIMRRLGYDLD